MGNIEPNPTDRAKKGTQHHPGRRRRRPLRIAMVDFVHPDQPLRVFVIAKIAASRRRWLGGAMR
jgi:hypothetical protein